MEDGSSIPLRGRVESLEREVTLLREAARRMARNERITATTEWIRHADVPAAALVSVVMCTRNRADLITRAIASVEAQSYPNWELVIIDHSEHGRYARATRIQGRLAPSQRARRRNSQPGAQPRSRPRSRCVHHVPRR